MVSAPGWVLPAGGGVHRRILNHGVRGHDHLDDLPHVQF
jgi:hypothetical protein